MKWASTFKYMKVNYGEDIARTGICTQRVSFINNIKGNKIRVRFSNKYSAHPLEFENVFIEKFCQGVLKERARLYVNGDKKIFLQKDQEAFSDEIPFNVRPKDQLVVSMEFKKDQKLNSICCFWDDHGARVSITKDVESSVFEIESDFIKNDPNTKTMSMFAGFDTVQVFTDDETKVVAAFGDSITHMSFYTDALYHRIVEEETGRASLLNCGIGGNRLINDATTIKAIGKEMPVFGKAGVERFEKDVFEIDDVDEILVLIGINDIMHPIQLEEKENTHSPAEIIEGYKKIIAIAHDNGAEIYFGTVTPSGNIQYPKDWLSKFESVRCELNSWIRKGDFHDGFFDFDRAIGDRDKEGFMKEGLSIGDGLHPNYQGGELMAKTVDLKTVMG